LILDVYSIHVFECRHTDLLLLLLLYRHNHHHLILSALIGDYNAGSFPAVLNDTFQADFKTYIKSMGKEFTLKGKELFMPVRLALTGRTSGPDIGEQLKLVGLSTAAGVTTGVVGLEERIKVLSEINVKV
jgi:glutamyl/glutaminyl-tRNA synthetase